MKNLLSLALIAWALTLTHTRPVNEGNRPINDGYRPVNEGYRPVNEG